MMWYQMLPYLKGGMVNLFFYCTLSVAYHQELATITYLTMAINTKTNSTALSYLSIITNKTVEMIVMKIFRFVEVATQSHCHEETDGFFFLDFTRRPRSFT